jgi:hypothetical protein
MNGKGGVRSAALTQRAPWNRFLAIGIVVLGIAACGRANSPELEPTNIPQPTPDRTMDAVIRSAASPIALGSPAPAAASPPAAPVRTASRTPQPVARPGTATPRPAAKPGPPGPAAINPTNVAPRLPTPKPAVINPTTVAPPRPGNGR